MANPLLDHAPPGYFADRRQVIETEEQIQNFTRLVEIIEADLGTVPAQLLPSQWRNAPVGIKLEFSWAEGHKKIPALAGRITTSIAAVCQRCLEPCEVHIATDLNMVLLCELQQANTLESGFSEFEVWELEEDTIRPLDIVEEALIMAMPLSPLHSSRDQCGSLAGAVIQETPDTVRPFADLKSQMGN